jgi:hypothetical protein
MSDSAQRPTDDCPFPWCATPHGATLHPDDEDHRSVGLLVPVSVREAGRTIDTEVEVGLVRRRGDAETWLVVEDGAAVHLEISLASVARVRAAVRRDPVLHDALDAGSADEEH